MACKKWCSSRQTKWALVGSASVVLVFAFGMVLSFVLQQRTRPGRGLPVVSPAWLPRRPL